MMKHILSKTSVSAAWACLCACVGLPSATIAATYSYDNQQRLIQVNFTDGKTLAFTYDATGNRLNAAVTAPGHTSGGTTAAPAEAKSTQPEQGRTK